MNNIQNVFTSTFNKMKTITDYNFLFISITRGPVPDYFGHSVLVDKTWAPSWELVKGYKSGSMSWNLYKSRYLFEVCLDENIDKWHIWLDTLRERYPEKTIILLCHCSGNCHRHVLAEKVGITEYIISEDTEEDLFDIQLDL